MTDLPRDIMLFQVAPYLPLETLYHCQFRTILLSRPLSEIMELVLLKEDPKLVYWLLVNQPGIRCPILKILIMSKKKSFLEALIDEDVFRKEEVAYYPINIPFIDNPSKEVGRQMLDLMFTLNEMDLLKYKVIQELMEDLAFTYQGETPTINGIQYDFATFSEYTDPWYIAEELLFTREDYARFETLVNQLKEKEVIYW